MRAVEVLRSRIQHQATVHPEAPAVIQDEESFSYAAFEEKVSALEDLIAAEEPQARRFSILAGQRFDTYASLVAVLSFGGTYSPIALETPEDKIRHSLEHFRPCVVLVDSQGETLLTRLISQSNRNFSVINVDRVTVQNPTRPARRAIPEEIAYVMFTSGSTGTPKGVKISRANLGFLFSLLLKTVPSREGGRVSQFSQLGFDLSVAEIFLPLLTGMAIVPPAKPSDRLSPMRFIGRHQLSHLISVPTLIDLAKKETTQLADETHDLGESVIFALQIGEPLLGRHVDSIKNLFPKLTKLLNCYGPTEATVLCSQMAVEINRTEGRWAPGEVIPIGKPVASHYFTVHEPDDRGVGELVVLGPLVGLGYLGVEDRPKKFFWDETKGCWGFFTGDLVREEQNGEYSFHGRKDRQIKIHGLRVELGDIEASIAKFVSGPVIAIANEEKITVFSTDPRVKERSFTSNVQHELSTALRSTLIPKHIRFLKSLPRSQSGKVDMVKLNSLARKF